jgi:hypothetical protein
LKREIIAGSNHEAAGARVLLHKYVYYYIFESFPKHKLSPLPERIAEQTTAQTLKKGQ